jgi:hypothetical protein
MVEMRRKLMRTAVKDKQPRRSSPRAWQVRDPHAIKADENLRKQAVLSLLK